MEMERCACPSTIGPCCAPTDSSCGEEPGLRFPDPKQFALDAADSRVKCPKLGWVRLRLSRPVTGELRNASIAREGERWCCALQVQLPDVAPAADLPPTLGVDLGVAAFAATSDGQIVAPLRALKRQQARLRRHQRRVSRKVKGSRNRGKAVARLGALHRRIARQRSDWLHKLTSDLASRHPVIAIEDLQVAALSASARGTAGRPGKNVRQKAGLNRSILDAAWGEFRRQIDYKLQAVGGRTIAVNPAYTSRTCRICGHESADNRKTQALFACVACGHREHADVHAAKNILAAGHAAWTAEVSGSAPPAACGGVVRRRPARKRPVGAAPVKQELAEGGACA